MVLGKKEKGTNLVLRMNRPTSGREKKGEEERGEERDLEKGGKKRGNGQKIRFFRRIGLMPIA